MCNYCKSQKKYMVYERQSNDRIPLCSEDIDFGICGKAILNLYVIDGDLYLGLSLHSRGGQSYQKLEPIDYCPMCGVKLERKPSINVEEDDEYGY